MSDLPKESQPDYLAGAYHSFHNPAEVEEPARRPILITLACLVAAASLAFTWYVFLPALGVLGLSNYFLALFIAQSVLIIVSLVGIWKMRLWGAYLYAFNFGLNMLVELLTRKGDLSVGDLFAALLVLTVFSKLRLMR